VSTLRYPNKAAYIQRRNGLDVEIIDLTAIQKLSVPCPTCAAAPRERCCEITNGAFRQDEHFARLLSAAGQGTSLRHHKPSAEVLPNVLRRGPCP
jgi:hypothetical protein